MSDYREAIDVVLQEVGRAVVGKEEITEKIMMAILAGGHILKWRIFRGWERPPWPLLFLKRWGLRRSGFSLLRMCFLLT